MVEKHKKNHETQTQPLLPLISSPPFPTDPSSSPHTHKTHNP
ncbi:unnamed protein product [Prunus brigantina]